MILLDTHVLLWLDTRRQAGGGMPRVTFLFLLSQHGLSPFGEEPDEIERDLDNAQWARRPQ